MTQKDVEKPFTEWNGSDRYSKISMIGKSPSATVYKVASKFDGKSYVAKELDKYQLSKNGVLDRGVYNEIKIMRKARHVRLPSGSPLTILLNVW